MSEFRHFVELLRSHLVALLCGGITGGGLVILGVFGFEYSFVSGLAVLLITLLAAAYLVWRDEFRRCKGLEERLKLRLEISAQTEASSERDYYRVRVRNLSATTIQFRAELSSISVPVTTPLPFPLRTTHSDLIAGGKDQLIDVFLLVNNNDFGIQLTDNSYCYVPRQRCEITICAYPVLPEDGQPTSRTFHIVPQQDGTTVFSAAN